MTHLSKLIRWTSLILALILLLEGATLFIGMVILNPGNPWAIPVNILFLILDILVAAGILRIVLRRSDPEKSILIYLLLVITIITHAYRAFEYFLQIPTRFLFNEALLVMNGLKLGIVVLVLIVGLYLYLKTPKVEDML